MHEHYMRLLVTRPLNARQRHIWVTCVQRFLNDGELDYGDQRFVQGTEWSLDNDELPYAYLVKLTRELNREWAENIVEAWSEIYPGDFQIETSIDAADCDDCDIELQDDLYENITMQINKDLHNRWVEQQIGQGWRYGLQLSESQKTNPRLRDWDTLDPSYRKSIAVTREQASEYFKRNRNIWN
jgi:hypothetical protein